MEQVVARHLLVDPVLEKEVGVVNVGKWNVVVEVDQLKALVSKALVKDQCWFPCAAISMSDAVHMSMHGSSIW